MLGHDIVSVFEFPSIVLDQDLYVLDINAHFLALFGDVKGQHIKDFAEAFNEKKFHRDITSSGSFELKAVPQNKIRTQFNLKLKPISQGFLGVAIDISALAKLDALLSSYSLLIEQQNKEIKKKNEQITIWRNRIESELEQAETVQDLLVPKQLITPHVYSQCKYLREMSGDFHELAIHEDGSNTLIVGDVAGKGIYAAIMLAQTLTAFRSSFECERLSDVAASIIEKLDGKIPEGLFVALTIVRQSKDKQYASVLNLGNPSALLVDRDGGFEEIESVGPAIGILPAEFYKTLEDTKLDIAQKKLFVFSDGLLDINLGPEFEAFLDSRDVAQHVMPLLDFSSSDIFTSLFETIDKFPQSDDIVIACMSPDAQFEA